MKNLKDFRIGKAFYFLENVKGSKIRINVNYAENDYEITILVDNGDTKLLKRQGEITASHMLSKKAKKNLVEKLVQLKL